MKNTTYYDGGLPFAPDGDYMQKEFYSRISYARVLKFYLCHPSRFIGKLDIAAKNSTMIRPPYLGNLIYENANERFALTGKFSLWSTVKKTFMPAGLMFVILFFSFYLLVATYEFLAALKSGRDRYRAVYAGVFLMLWAIGITQFAVPVLCNGEADLAKHMLLYNICFDMMLISAVIWVLHKMVSLSGILKLRMSTLFIMPALIIMMTFLSSSRPIDLPDTVGTTAVNADQSVNMLKTGDLIEFGRYGGAGITWQVIGTDDEKLTLMAGRIICFKAFDAASGNDRYPERQKYGSNNWSTSTLRTWLNSDEERVDYGSKQPDTGHVWMGFNSYDREPGFLSAFTADEKRAIKAVTHKSILSVFDAGLKDGGKKYYFWTNSIQLIIQNYDDAFFQYVEDAVFLPDIRDIKNVYDKGLNCRRAYSETGAYSNYWLRTPYATRASFVRYVGSDGYVYHKDAYYGAMGILPVLCLDRSSLNISMKKGLKSNS